MANILALTRKRDKDSKKCIATALAPVTCGRVRTTQAAAFSRLPVLDEMPHPSAALRPQVTSIHSAPFPTAFTPSASSQALSVIWLESQLSSATIFNLESTEIRKAPIDPKTLLILLNAQVSVASGGRKQGNVSRSADNRHNGGIHSDEAKGQAEKGGLSASSQRKSHGQGQWQRGKRKNQQGSKPMQKLARPESSAKTSRRSGQSVTVRAAAGLLRRGFCRLDKTRQDANHGRHEHAP